MKKSLQNLTRRRRRKLHLSSRLTGWVAVPLRTVVPTPANELDVGGNFLLKGEYRMLNRLFHAIIALTAVGMSIMVYFLVTDLFSEQELSWRAIATIVVHSLLMGTLAWRHTKLVFYGLGFQSPVVRTVKKGAYNP